MKLPIRTLRPAEFEDFMRFMERAYGHSREFFQRAYPHLYQPTPEKCASYYIIEKDGEILSHVGLYPIQLVTAGVELTAGGIGGVATLPAARAGIHDPAVAPRHWRNARAKISTLMAGWRPAALQRLWLGDDIKFLPADLLAPLVELGEGVARAD